MAWVYILRSVKSGAFYIGSTVNLNTRLNHHRAGGTPTTKKFGEVVLIFSQEYPALKNARIIERKLKKLKRKDYIEKIIKDGYIKITPE